MFDIKLHACFEEKKRFQFLREDCGHNVFFFITKGAFEYTDIYGEVRKAASGEGVFFHRDFSFERRVASPVTLHVIRFDCPDGIFSPYEKVAISPRAADDLNKLLPYKYCDAAWNEPTVSHYCRDALYEASERRTGENSEARQLLEYVDAHCTEELSNEVLCRRFGICEATMISLFKSVAGKTPHSYIVSKRIDLAKKLLVGTDMSCKEIALMCGYDDPLYFSRLFSAHENLSMTELRRRADGE